MKSEQRDTSFLVHFEQLCLCLDRHTENRANIWNCCWSRLWGRQNDMLNIFSTYSVSWIFDNAKIAVWQHGEVSIVTWQNCKNGWSNRFYKTFIEENELVSMYCCNYCKYRVSQNVPERNQKKKRGRGGRFKLFQILLLRSSNYFKLEIFCVVERKPLPTCYLPLLPTPPVPIWNNLKRSHRCSFWFLPGTFLWNRVLTRHRVFPVFGESAASQSQEWREADE